MMSGSKVSQQLSRDEHGFLKQPSDWSPEVAQQLASERHLALGPEHLEIIQLARRFYLEHHCHLTARALSKAVSQQLGKEKGNSLYLLSLFPGSPAKMTALLGGLPCPPFCF